MTRGLAAFGFGLATALAVGWCAIPAALYSRRAQPVVFPHQLHAEKSGVSQCADCHALRADGEFAGIPRVESCAACHSEPVGSSRAEATLVNEYIKKGREPEWLEIYGEPANVWFSHAIHLRRPGLKCAECHGAYGNAASQPIYQMDRISGYSRRTLDMSACEDCHTRRHVEVGCLGCHK